MSLAPVAASKAPVAYAALRTAAVAQAPAVRADPAARLEIRKDFGRPGMEAVYAARAAESARFDCRVTGPTETVRSFDRLALVIEGFEHLREIFEGVRAQARSDLGLDAGVTDATPRLDRHA